jgi:hypothetical protein
VLAGRGEKGHVEQNHRRQSEGGGIVDADPDELAGEEPGEGQGAGEAEDHPDQDGSHALAHHHPLDRGAGRPEGHADAHLADALFDEVRKDTVDPYRREEEGDERQEA